MLLVVDIAIEVDKEVKMVNHANREFGGEPWLAGSGLWVLTFLGDVDVSAPSLQADLGTQNSRSGTQKWTLDHRCLLGNTRSNCGSNLWGSANVRSEWRDDEMPDRVS